MKHKSKLIVGVLLATILIALPVWQSVYAEEEQITTSRKGPLCPLSPAVTILIDGFLIFFSFVNPLLGYLLALPFMGPTIISMIVNPIEDIMYRILAPLQRLSYGASVQEIMPEELYDTLQREDEVILIDMRSPVEYNQYHIEGAKNVPLREVVGFLRSGDLSSDAPVVFICKSSFRAYLATMSALAHGYRNVYNLHHGMDGGWLITGLVTQD